MKAYRKVGKELIQVDECDFCGGDECDEAFQCFSEWNAQENGATHFLLGSQTLNTLEVRMREAFNRNKYEGRGIQRKIFRFRETT